MLRRNDPCWCGSQKKWKKCCAPCLPDPSPELLAKQYQRRYGIVLKSLKQIEKIRQACQLAAHILDTLCQHAQPGVTTLELNALANRLHQEAGATPAPLHYGTPPFPKSICTSLNDVICHGIPDHRPLEEGDILNIDVTCILDGYYGDCSRMVCLGDISEEKQRVVDVAYESLTQSIAIISPGTLLNQIGEVIEKYATSHQCSVVYEFVGHGTGLKFHEPPQVLHASNKVDIPLAPGMIFTIEPMINAGKPEAVIDQQDQWTARTIDGKPSAQWEHTILVTETGHEILTQL